MAAFYKVNKDKVRPEPNFSAWVRPNETDGYLYFKANKTVIEINKHVNVQADHAELIREMGAKSTVLLKNSNRTLPLKKPKSIAVIGEDAQDPRGGPNACEDNRCYRGTLSMGYGSGTANYPYLVSPVAALRAQAAADGTALTNVEGNWDLAAARAAAAGAEAALVFASATAGENFITIDGNAGDRNNLTLWNGGDELIKAVAAVNPNTIVVLHTVGPVLIDYAKSHPNITAVVWAGLPGQESGNSLVDVLYGKVNPQAKSPFTWAARAEDYGAELMYRVATPGQPPSQSFPEGVFIDYRHFQKAHIAPTFEFGFGLSYTSFRYANLSVAPARSIYTPASGVTAPAPTGRPANASIAAAAYMAPEGFTKIKPYVYPWIEGPSLPPRAAAAHPGMSTNGSAQPIPPAGGAPGGNQGLYDVVYKIEFMVENTGDVEGTEIPQLVSPFFFSCRSSPFRIRICVRGKGGKERKKKRKKEKKD